MSIGSATTANIPVRSRSDLQATSKNADAGSELDAGFQRNLQEARQAIAEGIPDDRDIPSDVTDLLRQLDELSGRVGHDNNPYEASLIPDSNSPVAPQFQDKLSAVIKGIQTYADGKDDDTKGAVQAYVAHALIVIDNRLQGSQDNLSISLAQAAEHGVSERVLPNGKGEGANSFDEIQTQRDNIKGTLNTLLGSQSLNDLVSQFGKASYAASRVSNDSRATDDAYQSALGSLSDAVGAAKSQNSSAVGLSFLTHLVKDFGNGISTSFSQQQNEIKKDLTFNVGNASAVEYLKGLYNKLSGQNEKASQAFASVLQSLAGNSGASSSSNVKPGLFFNVKA